MYLLRLQAVAGAALAVLAAGCAVEDCHISSSSSDVGPLYPEVVTTYLAAE